MRKLVISLFIFATSCNAKQSGQNQNFRKDTTEKSNVSVTNTTLMPLADKKQLLGIWESQNKEPITVEITEDSIYYTEHFESHKYKLKDDSILIDYPDFLYAGKLYFDKDTLVMESEDGKSKFVRFKN